MLSIHEKLLKGENDSRFTCNRQTNGKLAYFDHTQPIIISVYSEKSSLNAEELLRIGTIKRFEDADDSEDFFLWRARDDDCFKILTSKSKFNYLVPSTNQQSNFI